MSSAEVHTFDTPGLSPTQFLYACMCNPSVPIMLRIEAADLLMRTGFGNAALVQR